MKRTVVTAMMVVALCACVAGASPSRAADTLAVHVNLEFDRSIASPTIQRIAKAEAAAIWRPYGVDLQWTDQGAATAMCLDVTVERSRRRRDDPLPVLAHATIASDHVVHAPIHVSFDAIDALLETRYADHPGLHDYTLATALGRVMAHELGHVLLGSPGYHDSTGLMRATFLADELARSERSRFQLANFSIVRLRARMASLCGAETAETCAIP